MLDGFMFGRARVLLACHSGQGLSCFVSPGIKDGSVRLKSSSLGRKLYQFIAFSWRGISDRF